MDAGATPSKGGILGRIAQAVDCIFQVFPFGQDGVARHRQNLRKGHEQLPGSGFEAPLPHPIRGDG